MKKLTKILPIALAFTLIGCKGNQSEEIVIPDITESGTVVILATGGTIAGSGEEGKETGYEPGTISVESLVASVPGIEEVAPLVAVQVCNINSDDMTSEIWIKLARTINQISVDYKDEVAGFVVLHGTDTMEETACFLNLTVNTDKPVVITGAMRPATAISADGPMNLYQSVVVAHSEESIGKGVLGVFSDSIYSARSMQKVSTFNVTAISAGPMGALGFVRNKEVFFYEASTKLHTSTSEFAQIFSKDNEITKLPKVNVAYFNVDADVEIIRTLGKFYNGLVIAGAGAGEFSEAFIKAIDSISGNCTVVISSRVDNGVITQDSVLCKNAIAANDLPPHKAAILLRLALQYKNQLKDYNLVKIFRNY
ncbi:MAG: asparaginase [Bacilli bacterium]|nr:asparaginase [Bacilli bacterium]